MKDTTYIRTAIRKKAKSILLKIVLRYMLEKSWDDLDLEMVVFLLLYSERFSRPKGRNQSDTHLAEVAHRFVLRLPEVDK